MDPIILSVIIILISILWIVRSRQKQLPFAGIPGPFALPIVGSLWQVFIRDQKELIPLTDDLFKRYGQFFITWRASKPAISIAKAEYMEVILSSNTNLKKGIIYRLLEPWLGMGLLTSSGQKWFHHRKLITPTFHFKILDNFIEVFNENSQILVDQLKKQIETDADVNIYQYITKCALDIVCETAMGTKVNSQISGESSYVNAVYRVSQITIKRNFTIYLIPDIIFYNTSLGKEYKELTKTLHSFTEGVIKARKESRKHTKQNNERRDVDEDVGVKKKRAFLDLLLDANEDEVGSKLTDTEIREEVDTFMFEGHDTTTAAICWTMYLLATHEAIQQEVYEEIKTIFEDDPTRQPTMQDLNEMKYLERVIKETLRLYPSVPFVTRELDNEVVLNNHTIPVGTLVLLSFRHLHMDPVYFPEPEKFDPDRFLPENVQRRHPYAYTPFSAGSRNCIGQKFAMLEEKVMLSYIIRHFKVSTQERVTSSDLLIELVLRPKPGLKIKFELRK